MTYKQTMSELKKLGTTQNVKVYKKHGAGDNVYGVSCALLKTLTGKIKSDHDLAVQLWDSGNVDAQTLATMIADPEKCHATLAERWINEVSYYMLADSVASFVAKAPIAKKKMAAWMKSKKEYVRQCGYTMLAIGLRDGLPLPVTACKTYLQTIEQEIKTSPNRAMHAMNMALIALGIYVPSLTPSAIATAKRIGKVKVDHGDTSCKTPDAIPYIERALKRAKKR